MDASSKFRDSLPTSPEHLLKTMKAMKLTYYLREHPPLKTVNDAKKYQKKNSGFHVKNLFLRDQKKRNYLLVTEQDDKIDLKIMFAVNIDCILKPETRAKDKQISPRPRSLNTIL